MLFAVVCVSLGLWQWDRRIARLEANQIITGNYGQEPVPLTGLLRAPSVAPGELPPDQEWRPVSATGHYLADATTLLRQRPVEGQAGYHVLVPFLVDPAGSGDATVLLVDRGFVPVGDDAESADVPTPPSGDVRVVVHLREGEEAFGQAPAGQIRSVDLPALSRAGWVAPALASAGGELSTAAYGVLAAETPRPASTPMLIPAPEVDEGPHLSYACQWWVFALGGFVGFGVVARRHRADLLLDAEEDEGGDAAAEVLPVHRPPSPLDRRPTGGVGAVRRAPAGRVRDRRRASAEDEEDALLDAAERRAGQEGHRLVGGPAGSGPVDQLRR